MGSKAQARRTKKSKERGRSVDVRTLDAGDLSGPMRHIIHAADNFGDYVASSGPAAASDLARIKARSAAARLAALAEPFDAFDVLESLRLAEMTASPETYQETEHDGSAAALELAAVVLLSRGHRDGTSPAADGHRARCDEAIEEIQQAAREALDAGSMIAVFDAMLDGGIDGSIGLGASLREVFVRNLAYPHMVEDTLAGLFDDPAVDAVCQQVVAYSVREIRAVFNALQELQQTSWNHRFDGLHELASMAKEELAKGRAANRQSVLDANPEESPSSYQIDPRTKARGRAIFESVWADPADASLIDIDEVALTGGVSTDTARTVVDIFAVDMAATDPGDAVESFLGGRSPFRTRPIVRAPGGDAVIVHAGLLVPAIQERVEELLKQSQLWEPYAIHRGHFLEEQALSLLKAVLPSATVHGSLEYFVPDPKAAAVQAVPASYTKVVEGDGLLLVDDVAIIVEAKSRALSPLARTGDLTRLTADLRKIVTDAAGQADRMRQRIVEDRGLRLRNGSWLDLEGVREIHTIAVSLDDLSGIATVTSHLVTAGLLPTDQLPWTVSLHDLRIVSEIVDRPAELLLYLRRRTEPDVTRKFHAVDELDFFLEFFATGLYVEPDPDRLRAELPQFGEPTVAQKRRYKAQSLSFLTSRTGPLDAFYFHQLGHRLTPAPKPVHNTNRKLLPVVDALAADGRPGWLSIGTTLLDASAKTQEDFAGYAPSLIRLSEQDGRRHTMCAHVGSRKADSFILIWASRPASQPVAEAEALLRKYVSAKKHQTQVARAVGFLFDKANPIVPRVTVFDNRRLDHDPLLDQLVIDSGLQPLSSSRRVLPRGGLAGKLKHSAKR